VRKPKIATDTEVFIARKTETGSEPVPACGLIGGTKDKPLPIPKMGDGFLMQEDNVTLEFNTPPTEDSYQFADNVQNAMLYLNNFLKSRGMFILKNPASMKFLALENRIEAEQRWPSAFQIGCSPDYSAYAESPGTARAVPNLPSFGSTRFAGMHFHCSFENPHNIPNWVFIRFIDLYVRLPLMNYDPQPERRNHYGLAGLYRPTKYPDGSTGIEYRSFSNAIAFNSSLTQMVSRAIMEIIEDVNKSPDKASNVFNGTDWDSVEQSIRNHDLALAYEVWNPAKTLAKGWARATGWSNGAVKQTTGAQLLMEEAADFRTPEVPTFQRVTVGNTRRGRI
jgi:hypothetical protein